MPLFIIERNFAEQLNLTDADVVATSKINGELGVNWVFSFLSADKRKTTVSMRPRIQRQSGRPRVGRTCLPT